MTEKKQRFHLIKDTGTDECYLDNLYDNDTYISAICGGSERVCNLLNELHEENEQLKAQLKKGEDVCSICKHQYLTKRDTDKYYIAKCKKEHLECSKGTVSYCEDFECKEVTE